MNDKSQAIKKITIQGLKGKKIDDDKRKEIVDGILKANIPMEDNMIIESEMPKTILGVGINWKTITIDDELDVIVDKIEINKSDSQHTDDQEKNEINYNTRPKNQKKSKKRK